MIFHSKSQAQDMLSSGVPIHDARVFETWIVVRLGSKEAGCTQHHGTDLEYLALLGSLSLHHLNGQPSRLDAEP